MNAAILISVGRDASGFVVTDSRGRTHHAVDEERLGALVTQLLADDTMPQSRIQKQNGVVGLLAGVARRVVPRHAEIVDAAEPVGHQLTALAPIVHRRWLAWRGDGG